MNDVCILLEAAIIVVALLCITGIYWVNKEGDNNEGGS